jgi:hypothetical protein
MIYCLQAQTTAVSSNNQTHSPSVTWGGPYLKYGNIHIPKKGILHPNWTRCDASHIQDTKYTSIIQRSLILVIAISAVTSICCSEIGGLPARGSHSFFSRYIYIYIYIYKRSPLWSSGLSSWLQIQRSGFDSRRYQIF